MFEARLEESLGDPSALLRLTADNLVEERRAGCRKLVLAAAWADCHSAPGELELADDSVVEAQSVLLDRFVRIGPQGTPLVAESCPAEFGNALQTGPMAARNLIRIALIVRYRLPRLWVRVQAGEVWLWKVRHIAEASAHLSALTSWELDRQVTPYVETLAWGRFLQIFDAALLQVDEATYRRRAEEAAAQRDVRSYRGEYGLRTLVAKAAAGDVAAFEALVARVAECLAEDGDEDPVAVRRSKAIGIIAHQARLRDLLARHADQPHDPRHPDERVAAHQADPTDPWGADDLPSAGWETDRQGNYHQPGFDDLDDLDDCQTSQQEPGEHVQDEEPVGAADQAWNDQQNDDDHDAGRPATPWPPAFHRGVDDDHDQTDRLSEPSGHCSGCRCGSTFDLRPFTQRELAVCRMRVVAHVHVTDQTLIDQHGVVRTADGPITLEQFRRWLTDTDPSITVRPVRDPAGVAAVDAYEIPVAMREAIHTRHPGSVWPFSSVAEVSIGGRLDLDHCIPYVRGGPPGQTRLDNLGPLARSEHRPKTIANWQVRQPAPGIYVWRSPHGIINLVTNQGTLRLGDNPYGHAIWQAANTGSSEPTV